MGVHEVVRARMKRSIIFGARIQDSGSDPRK
jgi:hypothetical protein